MADGCLVSIAGRLSKTPAQVVLRWLYQRRIASIPKSVTPARIQLNLQVMAVAFFVILWRVENYRLVSEFLSTF